MITTIQSSLLRAALRDVIDQVFHHREPVEVTRNGHTLVAIVHRDDFKLLQAAKEAGLTLESVKALKK